ncbi:MAG: hypothetical protein ACKPKO_09995, partial [Candidatus Fonsibacter sp.]
MGPWAEGGIGTLASTDDRHHPRKRARVHCETSSHLELTNGIIVTKLQRHTASAGCFHLPNQTESVH